MSKVAITLSEKQIELDKGITKVDDLYENSGITPNEKRLYLDKTDDIDIPLLPNEYIVIHGGEVIFSGDIDDDIEDNPLVRNPVHFELNGKKIEQGLEKAKVNSNDISCRDGEIASPRLFVDLAEKVDDVLQDNITLIVQDTDSYFTAPTEDDFIDVEECSKKERRPPKGQKYKIKIDKEPYKVEQQKMTGSKILALANKNYREWSLNEKLRGGRRKPIEEEQVIDFSKEGVERFETVMRQAQQGQGGVA